mgnify:CR=1 FL=1
MKKAELCLIVAVAENMAIGLNNQLLWHLSDDLKRFKNLTTGHTVIMGRNTFLSLPKGALPNRKNIVVSHLNDHFPGAIVVSSPEKAIEHSKDDLKAFIMGGGMIYNYFFPLVDRLYLTLVHHPFEADTFFPAIDYSQWDETCRTYVAHDPKFEHAYSFVDLKRKQAK